MLRNLHELGNYSRWAIIVLFIFPLGLIFFSISYLIYYNAPYIQSVSITLQAIKTKIEIAHISRDLQNENMKLRKMNEQFKQAKSNLLFLSSQLRLQDKIISTRANLIFRAKVNSITADLNSVKTIPDIKFDIAHKKLDRINSFLNKDTN